MTLSTSRRMLMAGGLAAAGLMTAGWRTREDRPLGYAMVGLGGYAEIIMGKFAGSRHSRLAGLVSGTSEKLARFGDQCGVPDSGRYSYETFDRIADNPDIDIVYVTLPNSLHAEYVIRAARAGKHVLVEKPMATTAAEAEAMIAACREAGVKLAVGYRSRFEAANIEAIRMAQAGELGKLSVLSSEHGFNAGPGQWRLNRALAGGGSLMDIGIYSLQAARYLTGEEPVSVTAVESTDRSDPRFAEVEDRINFLLKFPSGVVADCISTYSSNHNQYRIAGADRWLDAEPATAYAGNTLRVGTPWGGSQPHAAPPTEVDQFAGMLDHVAVCARTGAEPIISGEEGLKDMRLIEAIYRSAREGRTIAV